MEFVVVTGMSGAGKRTAMKFFEDENFFCIDNLPPTMVLQFVDLALKKEERDVAMGIDVRSGEDLSELNAVFSELEKRKLNFKILFLEAENEVLVKRYKETRRNHPLAGVNRIIEGIKKEREDIAFIKKRADYIIDTTNLLTRELKREINRIFNDGGKNGNLMITIVSFGFKYGIPDDADLVFDVRFLPNPFYVPELKPLTGKDAPVHDFVMKHAQAGVFLNKLMDMLEFLIPNYIVEGKTRLVIGIGCTGGRHRSVALAREVFERLTTDEYGVNISHRDIDMDIR